MADAPVLSSEQATARRKRVRRTVLLFAIIAVALYAGFLLMATLSSGALK